MEIEILNMDCLSYLIEAFETWICSALVLTPLCRDAQLALLNINIVKKK